MDLSAFITAGFLGLASGSFDGGGANPIGAGVGTPTYGDFNAPVVQLLPDKPQAPAAPAGLRIPIHKESDFPFVIIVPDDGKDPSGGWQAAKANLEFFKIVIPRSVTKWKCRITIQIPIRHSTRGYIAPDRAANMSTLVTNVVTVNMDYELPQGIFCDRFRSGVKAAFPLIFPKLGETVGL